MKRNAYRSTSRQRVFLSWGVLLLTGITTGCDGFEVITESRDTYIPAECIVSDCGVTDPIKMGPYRVGVTDRLYFDHDRDAMSWDDCGDLRRTDGSCPRPLVTSIWYPATEDAAPLPQVNISDFIDVPQEDIQDLIDWLLDEVGGPDDIEFVIPDKPGEARRDAPLRKGRYPIIMFSHGAGGVRFQNIFQVEWLASHGFVVVSADHEGDSTFTIINNKMVPLVPRGTAFAKSGIERPIDMRFLIDRMFEANSNRDDFFYGHLVTEAIGATGHSYGAFTSLTLADQDTRIKAALPMAMGGLTMQRRSMPVMYMYAAEDDTIDGVLNDELIPHQFGSAPTPMMSINMLDAGHFTFSNMCDLLPEFGDGCGVGERVTTDEAFSYVDPVLSQDFINFYTIAFFGHYLKGVSGYKKYLLSEPFRDKLRYEYSYRLDPDSATTTKISAKPLP